MIYSYRIKCPYCGEENVFAGHPGQKYAKDIETCRECEKDFVLQTTVDPVFKVFKIEGEE